MKWELWKKIVDECSQYEDVILEPAWEGEPMLHPQFEEFMAYAITKLGERICLTTDGTLISEQNMETLSNLRSITVNVNSDKGFENAVGLQKGRYNGNEQHTYLTLSFVSGSEAAQKYFDYIVGDPYQEFRGFDFVVYYYDLKEGSPYHDPYVGKTILIDPEGSVAPYLHPYDQKGANLDTSTLADIWRGYDLKDSPDQVYRSCATRNRYGSQFYNPANEYSQLTDCPRCDGFLFQNSTFCFDCERQDGIAKLTSQIQEITDSKILSGYKVFRMSPTEFEAYKLEDLEEDDDGPYSYCDSNGDADEIAEHIQDTITSELDMEGYSCSQCGASIKRNETICLGCYEREGLDKITSDIIKITEIGIVSDAMIKRISPTEFEVYNDQHICKCSGNAQKVAEYVYFFYPY
ncbi:radical SAM protein [Croceifilum oryzae]|nr:hypothetical protein [Croceifilum oryzae]